ncbi:MAG: PHP domain-containing protein [Anaerolineae bacterium]
MNEHITNLTELEAPLSDFDPSRRREALQALVALARQGVLTFPPDSDVVNMHCHTFFSFNAYGYSPIALAWLAKRRGFRAVGIVDFDVLDGVEEFLEACELLEVRGTAGLETRVYIPAYADKEINSPGEPGICYHIGIGFTSRQAPADVAETMDGMRRRAAQRNQEIVARVNAYLNPVTVDYERDVLPLSPAGNPTERHIVQAYIRAATQRYPDPAGFWAARLEMPRQQVEEIMRDSAGFQNLVRSKLMKRGGVGYVQPSPAKFPTLEELNRLIHACGALSCCAWLDGFSAVEQDAAGWLSFQVSQGAVAINIVPDRNWNVADESLRRQRVARLHEIIRLAGEFDLPILVGTEMNSFGQKLVDDFDAPALAPYRQRFLDGAFFVVGHTILQRALGLGFHSAWAREYYPERSRRNAFFIEVGRRTPPGRRGVELLQSLGAAPSPVDILAALPNL